MWWLSWLTTSALSVSLKSGRSQVQNPLSAVCDVQASLPIDIVLLGSSLCGNGLIPRGFRHPKLRLDAILTKITYSV